MQGLFLFIWGNWYLCAEDIHGNLKADRNIEVSVIYETAASLVMNHDPE